MTPAPRPAHKIEFKTRGPLLGAPAPDTRRKPKPKPAVVAAPAPHPPKPAPPPTAPAVAEPPHEPTSWAPEFVKPVTRLYVNFWRAEHPERQQELIAALSHNLANACIDEVVVLHHEACALPVDHPKIVSVPMAIDRPTFYSYFAEANSRVTSAYDRSVIINADCYLAGGMEQLARFDVRGYLLCLSRRAMTLDGDLDATPKRHGGHDAWIFSGRTPHINLDFHPGKAHCDWVLASLFQRAGYRLANPCLSIELGHLHRAPGRNHRPRVRQALDPDIRRFRRLPHVSLDAIGLPRLPDGSVDVVWKLGAGSKLQDWELRISLRSFQQHYKSPGSRFWIIGHIPAWVDQDQVRCLVWPDPYYSQKDANLIGKALRLAFEEGLSEEFIFCSDDCVLLKPAVPADFMNWHCGEIPKTTRPETGAWQKRVNHTGRIMRAAGYPARNFEGHVPYKLQKSWCKAALRFPYADGGGMTVHSTILNAARVVSPAIGGAKVRGWLGKDLDAGTVDRKLAENLFATLDNGSPENPYIMAALGRLFPVAAVWELDRRGALPTIDEVFRPFGSRHYKRGTNKLVQHGYGAMYETLLTPLRGTGVRLLEIGVATGAGLAAWQAYLGDRAVVSGVDVSTQLVRYPVDVLKADACAPHAADGFSDASVDVLIDDATHRIADQWAIFGNFWSKVKPGGLYVIEDIVDPCGFAERFAGTCYRWWDTRFETSEKLSLCAVFVKDDTAAYSVEIHTLRFGNPDWLAVCAPTLDAWCARHGMLLKVWDKPEEGKYPGPKFVEIDMLRDFVERSEHTHMMFVDADIFIHPDAPRPPLGPGLSLMTDADHHHHEDNWRQWCLGKFGALPGPGSLYHNAGVWICDKKAAQEMLVEAQPPFHHAVGSQEQKQFNWWVWCVSQRGVAVNVLPLTWNRGHGQYLPSWLFHLWGPHKLRKLEEFRKRGLLEPAAVPTRGCISFSLFGEADRYCRGMLENLRLAKAVYAGWAVVVYVVAGHYLAQQLRDEGAEVVEMPPEPGLAGTFWRFLAADDNRFTHVVFRDVDGRLSARDVAYVTAWIASDRPLHALHDRARPPRGRWRPLLAGCWGVKPGSFSMRDAVAACASRHRYGDDERFLETAVFPLFDESQRVVHSSLQLPVAAVDIQHSPACLGYHVVSAPKVVEDPSRAWRALPA